MRICLYDVAASGHHPSFRAGLAKAALAVGAEVIVASPDPHELQGIEWMHAEERGRGWSGRRQFRHVSDHCREVDVDMFADLNFDRNVWLIPQSHNRLRVRRHVLHHANQYLSDRSSAVSRLRTVVLRRYLYRVTNQGARIVVHTPKAKEILEPHAAPDSILQFGYPIDDDWIVQEAAIRDIPADHQKVLFVGRARREKGLRDLLEAASILGQDVVIQVAGPQDAAVVRALRRSHPETTFEWFDRFVSDAELRKLFRKAAIVAVPYRQAFRSHGGASGVLLQALAQGKPLLATDAVADQLPAGYEGAVVVPAEDPPALAEGLEHALRALGKLNHAAMAGGPLFVGRRHTFDGYAKALMSGWTTHG